MCEGSDYLKLTEPSGVLSSSVVADTQCGSPSCPWVLQARPGQHYNLTLLDFSHLDEARVQESSKGAARNLCHRYLTVREGDVDKDVTTCSQKYTRESHIFTSSSNSIQLTLYTAGSTSNIQYLIKYQGMGKDTHTHSLAENTREKSSLCLVLSFRFMLSSF